VTGRFSSVTGHFKNFVTGDFKLIVTGFTGKFLNGCGPACGFGHQGGVGEGNLIHPVSWRI
jgi:hypothetical protein